jgi:hypothetical protein
MTKLRVAIKDIHRAIVLTTYIDISEGWRGKRENQFKNSERERREREGERGRERGERERLKE